MMADILCGPEFSPERRVNTCQHEAGRWHHMSSERLRRQHAPSRRQPGCARAQMERAALRLGVAGACLLLLPLGHPTPLLHPEVSSAFHRLSLRIQYCCRAPCRAPCGSEGGGVSMCSRRV